MTYSILTSPVFYSCRLPMPDISIYLDIYSFIYISTSCFFNNNVTKVGFKRIKTGFTSSQDPKYLRNSSLVSSGYHRANLIAMS